VSNKTYSSIICYICINCYICFKYRMDFLCLTTLVANSIGCISAHSVHIKAIVPKSTKVYLIINIETTKSSIFDCAKWIIKCIGHIILSFEIFHITFRLDQCTTALMCIGRVHPIKFAINVDHRRVLIIFE